MSEHSMSLRLGPAGSAGVVTAMAVAAMTGIWLSVASPQVPGTEPLGLEDVVDVIAILCLGALGAILVTHRRAVGLGGALVLMASMESVSYLSGGLADFLADGRTDPPAVARLFNVTAQASFVVAFFLLAAAPALLFPTGRLVGPRWRPVAWVAVTGVVLSVLALLLAPGPVDDDVSAWGDNPLGIDALAPVTDAAEVLGGVLLVASVAAGIAAVISRWVRYRGARRRQMAWFTAGLAIELVALVTDTDGSDPVLQVTMALAVFSALLVGIGWPLLGPLGSRAETADGLTRVDPEHENAPT